MRNVYDNHIPSLPSKYNLLEKDHQLLIKVRWFKLKHILALLFSVFWIGFIAAFYSRIVTTHVPNSVYLFPIIHTGVGLVTFYYACCGFLNYTLIEVSKKEVIIKYLPLPWVKYKTINRYDITLLHVTEEVKSLKGTTTITFDVQAITEDGKAISLVRGLEKIEQARYIERKIEDMLFRQEEGPTPEKMAS